MSNVWVKLPLVTPSGKPEKVGSCVATPAVGVTAIGETQQWMCEAVVVPVRPLKVTETVMVCAASSQRTVAVPVPGEPLGGNSLAPLSVVVNVKMAALAWLTANTSPAANAAAKIEVFFQRIALPSLVGTATRE